MAPRSSAVALSLVLLAACGGSQGPVPESAPRPAVQFGELEIDGQLRRYRVFVPPTVEDSAVPLVLALHDAFANA